MPQLELLILYKNRDYEQKIVLRYTCIKLVRKHIKKVMNKTLLDSTGACGYLEELLQPVWRVDDKEGGEEETHNQVPHKQVCNIEHGALTVLPCIYSVWTTNVTFYVLVLRLEWHKKEKLHC